MRLIQTYHSANREAAAKVYRSAEWEEYIVRFFRQGSELRDAAYHTDDKGDALNTAKYEVSRFAFAH